MSTFLEVVELLLTNDDAKTAYTSDPDRFLDDHGLGSFDSDDVSDAMGHAADALPMPIAARLDPDAGLDSAVGVDLDQLGLTLERDPILASEDVGASDLDPHDLDSASYGEDVDFDTPEVTEQTSGDIDPLDSTISDLDLHQEVVEEIVEPSVTPDDLPDELTEIPIDELAHGDEPLDDARLSLDGTTDPLDDLDAHLTTDTPDDFDLLD